MNGHSELDLAFANIEGNLRQGRNTWHVRPKVPAGDVDYDQFVIVASEGTGMMSAFSMDR